jgi:hypothetical protein
MIILYFNARGVGGTLKKLSLNRINQSHNHEVILLQETKSEGTKARDIFEKWLKSWYICTIDVEGHSGGLLTGWSPSCKQIYLSSFSSAISVKLEVKDMEEPMTIINVYGACTKRISFWKNIVCSGALNNPLTLIGRDFNFTLNLREFWGPNPRRDTQSDFFSTFLEKHHLIDFKPMKLVSTWRNF